MLMSFDALHKPVRKDRVHKGHPASHHRGPEVARCNEIGLDKKHTCFIKRVGLLAFV
jgi:hypothetical protein